MGISKSAKLFAQLPGVVHDFASRSSRVLVLHAGAVRGPSGQVVIIAGDSGSGKSTLVAALILAGCDYLGEEMIGVTLPATDSLCYPTPLALDTTGRGLLGLAPSSSPYTNPQELRSNVKLINGQVGPISQIIFPAYTPDAKK